MVCFGFAFVMLGVIQLCRSSSSRKEEERKEAVAAFANRTSNDDYRKESNPNANNRIMVINENGNGNAPHSNEVDMQKTAPAKSMFAKNPVRNFSLTQANQAAAQSGENPSMHKTFTFTTDPDNKNNSNSNPNAKKKFVKLEPVSEKYAYHNEDDEEEDEEEASEDGHENAGFFLNEEPARAPSPRPAQTRRSAAPNANNRPKINGFVQNRELTTQF